MILLTPNSMAPSASTHFLLEDMGLCSAGEGRQFVKDRHSDPAGQHPVSIFERVRAGLLGLSIPDEHGDNCFGVLEMTALKCLAKANVPWRFQL